MVWCRGRILASGLVCVEAHPPQPTRNSPIIKQSRLRLLPVARAITQHRNSWCLGEGTLGRGFFEDLGLCWLVSRTVEWSRAVQELGIFTICLGARRVKVGVVVIMEEAAALFLVRRGGCWVIFEVAECPGGLPASHRSLLALSHGVSVSQCMLSGWLVNIGLVPLSEQLVTFSSAKLSVCVGGCGNQVCHFYPGL